MQAALHSALAPAQHGPTDLAGWTEAHCRLAGRPYTIPPLYDAIYRCTDHRVIVRKAAQTFASQYLIHAALWCADVGAGGRGTAFYVFPAEKQLGEFVRDRVEPVIQRSPDLRKRLGKTDNTFQKAIGPGMVYFRGTKAEAGLISVAADLAILDEIARYPQAAVDMIEPRLSSSYLNWQRAASTPVYPSDPAGILWEQSSQQYYYVACSHCGTRQSLTIDANLEPETGMVFCRHCHGDMRADRLTLGEWVAEKPGAHWTGFQISKLYSHRVDLADLGRRFAAVLRGDAPASAVQQFWNQEKGESYMPKGGHLEAEHLDACCSDPEYTRMPDVGENCVMGVDIGALLHVTIWQPKGGKLYLAHLGTYQHFAELGPLVHRYGVKRCVVDGEPETRAARAFADDKAFHRRIYLADYPPTTGGNKSLLCRWDEQTRTVKIHRTMALDQVLHNVYTGFFVLPSPPRQAQQLGGAIDARGLGMFYRQMLAPIRVMRLTDDGEQEAMYDQNGADHYAHSVVYAIAAAEQAVGEIGVVSVRPSPAQMADATNPYGDVAEPIDAFYLQHEANAAWSGQRPYARGSDGKGGFITASGHHIRPTPDEWSLALESDDADDEGEEAPAPAYLRAHAPVRQAAPNTTSSEPAALLPPLDFTHAFANEEG
ncbi:MAG: phage terminase large subunit family protein [Patescibacteria group bacterium]|nr:phage terminase large subunit family protein [Patescibacteria group bacterium]